MNKQITLPFNFVNAFGWSWLHWLVIALVSLVAFIEVYERQTLRIKRVSNNQIEVIEKDITQYNTMAERLATMEVLPPVKKQWDYAIAISKKYGVQLNYLGSSSKYNGPLESWAGKIVGKTGAVLVVAKELQETVPTFLYDFNLNGESSTFDFAVLGSE